MPQFRFDSCASYTGLSPDVEIRRVTFEPPQNAQEADTGFGIVTVNNSFIERVVNQAQDTWFDDIEAQKYISSRVILSTDANFTQLLVNIINVINADRRGDYEGDDVINELGLIQTFYSVSARDGRFNFTEDQATLLAGLLGIDGIHVRNGQFHPGADHATMELNQIRMRVCVDLLKSDRLNQNNVRDIRFASGYNLDAQDFSLLQIYRSLEGQAGAIEKTIGDDGEEIRRSDLPLARFRNARLEVDHVTIFCFSYVNTDAIRSEFDITPDNTILDFTYSKISTATVSSTVYIRPILVTAEQIDLADQEIVAPDNGIFQDLRGLFSLSGQALQGGDSSQVMGGIEDSPVDLSRFEDEIRSMSVDVDESVYAMLARDAVVFSDLWASRRRNDEVDLAFAFNEQRFLQQNSVFPKIYTDEVFAEMARNLGSGITRIQVYKHQLDPANNVVANSLGTTSRNTRSTSNQAREIIGSTGSLSAGGVSEFTNQIYLGSENNILQGMRFFTTTDFHETEEERARASGKKFEYGLEIDYLDASVDMLLLLVNAFLEKENTLRKVVSNLGTMPSSTPEERTLLHASASNEVSLAQWMTPIMNSLSNTGVLQGATGNILDIITTLGGNADMSVFERAEGIQRIADIFSFYGSELENELRRAVPGIQIYPGDDSPENATAYVTNANSGQSASRSIVTKNFVFKNIVETTNNEGYDYLNVGSEATPNVGLEIKTLTDFLARADQETDKYFLSSQAVAGIEDTKIKYFTPATIVDSIGGDIVQTPDNIYNYDRYTNFTANVLERSSLKAEGNQNKIKPDKENVNSANTTTSLINQLLKLGARIKIQAPTSNKNINLASISDFTSVALGTATGSQGKLQQSDMDEKTHREQFARLEVQDIRDLQIASENIYKPLANLVGPIKISSENRGANKAEKKNSFSQVVLDMDEDMLADISELPNQIKAMIKIVTTKFNGESEEYQNYRYDFDELRELRGPRGQLTGLSDPMRNYSQFASYWLNFKQIKKVEILTSFNKTRNEGYDVANAVWREIDIQDVNNLGVNQIMLCRFSSYTGEVAERIGSTSNSGIDLPIYNEYFFLTRTLEEQNIRVLDDERTETVTIDEIVADQRSQFELDRNRSMRVQLSDQIAQMDPVTLQDPAPPVMEMAVEQNVPLQSQVEQFGYDRYAQPAMAMDTPPFSPRDNFQFVAEQAYARKNQQTQNQVGQRQEEVVQRRTESAQAQAQSQAQVGAGQAQQAAALANAGRTANVGAGVGAGVARDVARDVGRNVGGNVGGNIGGGGGFPGGGGGY